MTHENDSKKEDAAEGSEAKAPESPKAEASPTADAGGTEPKASSVPPKAASVPPKAASVPPKAAGHGAGDGHHGRGGKPASSAPEFRVRLAYDRGGAATNDGPSQDDFKARRLLAQYDTTAEVVHAAETLRDAGYSAFEAHSPFPIHGMDRAMGLKDSRLGWIVLACGLTGVSCAWLMMFWMNGIDYPIVIGGKPPGTLPSMVPIMFEVTVLLSSFGAVLGMFGLNRLPQHHDPLFYSDRFAAFSNDKFFISVESGDPKFDTERTQALLRKTKPVTIEIIEDIEEEAS